MILDKFK